MRLLLVDDDGIYRSRLAKALRRQGAEVTEAEGPEEAYEKIQAGAFEGAVMDLRMPGGSGLDLVARLFQRDRGLRVVVLTGYGSIPIAVEAMRRGAIHVLQKPATAQEILAALQGEASSPAEDTPSLDRVEWEHLQRVLADCEGNISEAARRLGMHRRSLQRKLDRPAPKA